MFQNFIVLGIIPGTNIQINFQLWLGAILLLVLVWELKRLFRNNELTVHLLQLSVRRRQAAIDAITL